MPLSRSRYRKTGRVLLAVRAKSVFIGSRRAATEKYCSAFVFHRRLAADKYGEEGNKKKERERERLEKGTKRERDEPIKHGITYKSI